ncbi:MAG: hypothetical protein Q7S58_16205 [Candidatus Binatus sp.]|uniref:hypothetical protein n=1 Tax=Candidatus Binatus sp. TaxID=2811406 RepID=UPI00272012EA|nr:hypothetical protein [Candidatus Binatus sp.]MDO8433942.1 hypothetical protein [Candidatus Binatus sp.]
MKRTPYSPPRAIRRSILLCAIFAALVITPSLSRAAENLLKNGDFSTGSGDQPDVWRTEAWINKPESFETHWTNPPAPGISELEVNNIEANDGRWMQSLTLGPGWYELSAEVRTENVGDKETGASISVLEDGVMSADIHGTSGWQRVSLYLRVGKQGADIDVGLRVGGFGSLNTGKAFFKNSRLIKIDAPPPQATPAFDLTEIRKQALPVPIGRPYSMVLTFIGLILVAIVGWRVFGEEQPVAQPASDAAKKRTERAARR